MYAAPGILECRHQRANDRNTSAAAVLTSDPLLPLYHAAYRAPNDDSARMDWLIGKLVDCMRENQTANVIFLRPLTLGGDVDVLRLGGQLVGFSGGKSLKEARAYESPSMARLQKGQGH